MAEFLTALGPLLDASSIATYAARHTHCLARNYLDLNDYYTAVLLHYALRNF